MSTPPILTATCRLVSSMRRGHMLSFTAINDPYDKLRKAVGGGAMHLRPLLTSLPSQTVVPPPRNDPPNNIIKIARMPITQPMPAIV